MPTKPVLLALCLLAVPLAGCMEEIDYILYGDENVEVELHINVDAAYQCDDHYMFDTTITNTWSEGWVRVTEFNFYLINQQGRVWDAHWQTEFPSAKLYENEKAQGTLVFDAGYQETPLIIRYDVSDDSGFLYGEAVVHAIHQAGACP